MLYFSSAVSCRVVSLCLIQLRLFPLPYLPAEKCLDQDVSPSSFSLTSAPRNPVHCKLKFTVTGTFTKSQLESY
jgi:hypothetical protein